MKDLSKEDFNTVKQILNKIFFKFHNELINGFHSKNYVEVYLNQELKNLGYFIRPFFDSEKKEILFISDNFADLVKRSKADDRIQDAFFDSVEKIALIIVRKNSKIKKTNGKLDKKIVKKSANELSVSRRNFLKLGVASAAALGVSYVVVKSGILGSFFGFGNRKFLKEGYYYINYSSNIDIKYAKNNVLKLNEFFKSIYEGFNVEIVKANVKGKEYYKVLIGPFASEDESGIAMNDIFDNIPESLAPDVFYIVKWGGVDFEPISAMVNAKSLKDKKIIEEEIERKKGIIYSNDPKIKFVQVLVKKYLAEYNQKFASSFKNVYVDNNIIISIIKNESGFNPNAKGYDIEKIGGKWYVKKRNGKKVLLAKGLMQLTKWVAKNEYIIKYIFVGNSKLAIQAFFGDDFFNPDLNIRCGILHYAYTYNFFIHEFNKKGFKSSKDDFLKIVFAAYNGGVTRIRKNIRVYSKKHNVKFIEYTKLFRDINFESREYAMRCYKDYLNFKKV